jgi:hypothetical protein
MQIFGFEIKRKGEMRDVGSVVPPASDDGTTVVSANTASYYGMVMDLDTIIKNENDLIRRYREVSQYADCDMAIEDIINEAIISENDNSTVKINLDKLDVSNKIKDKVRDEFSEILKLLKFDHRGHDIFKNWYVDGRLYYNVLVDPKNPKVGIQEMRFVDPRKIRKIKAIDKKKDPKGIDVVTKVDEYYIYNDKGITESSTSGIRMSLDSIVYAPSGLIDNNTGIMMSYLHKAIKPTNQLKMIEDAVVIYRISRAPERRVFYVDVGNLPKIKAEQYVTDIMNKFRNKIVYDATTGETRDDRRHLSMMEDFWMPRREGGKGTEITTLPGGQNLGDIEDIQYFQRKLYQALNVPMSRLEASTGFALGRSTEITRDEIKFNKFINRIRKKFSYLFNGALRIQLIAKGIIAADEWEEIEDSIYYDYQEDNHFSELKDNELLMGRIAALQQLDPYIGKYYSISWVRKNVLMQTDDEIEQMEKEIEEDREIQLDQADHDGQVAGVQQVATQNYAVQNSIPDPSLEQEAPPPEQPNGNKKESK